MSRTLAELLVKEKVIPPARFTEAESAAQGGKSYVRYLIERGYVSETKLLYFLSQKFQLPSINIAKFDIPDPIIHLVPGEVVKKYQVIPIQSSKGTVVVCACDPTHVARAVEDLKFRLKTNVEVVLTTHTAFDAAMSKYYSGVASVGAAIESYQKEARRGEDSSESVEHLEIHNLEGEDNPDDAPIISLINGILSESIRQGASDIHVEPYERRFRVRLRIDGVLREILQIPMEMRRAAIARLKIMSRMDISESRVPQDGRIKIRVGSKEVDFRVNTLPTLFGEKVVLRLLSQGSLQLDLRKLGFEAKQLEIFKKAIYAPNGMVLVTGPTGSGKTTTLYSGLSELNQTSDNISTCEDPVEYNLEGINQVQINKDVGLTFASVLRSLLRQDPDIILVGEIRDYETAEIAVQAALTGHLVLSTLHTNDAPSSITRLMNMGLEPFLVTASVNCIVAQRLLRTVCPKCKTDHPVPKENLTSLGFNPDQLGQIRSVKGKGCAFCNNTGYKGRVAIYEVFDFTTDLKEMVLKGETVTAIKKQAVKNGLKTLRMSALSKFAEGQTTLEEALSMTMET